MTGAARTTVVGAAIIACGPGFIVYLSERRSRGIRGYLTWTAASVAEISPFILEAWVFPSAAAANDGLYRSLGLRTETLAIALFPNGRHP
jgi:hypothetical protein